MLAWNREKDGERFQFIKGIAVRLNEFGQAIGDELAVWQRALLPQKEVLSGRFCYLEPVNMAKHEKQLYQAYHSIEDGRDWTYLFKERPETEAEFHDYMLSMINATDAVHYAVMDTNDGHVLGTVALMRIDNSNGVIEIGAVNWSPLLKRNSAGTEAIYLLLSYVFDTLGYRRCEWKCDSCNEPSRNAAKRYGFKYEGQFRQAIVVKGRNRDTDWFSIIDGEWPEVKRAITQWLSTENFTADGKQKKRLQDFQTAI
ncbi:putative acetyltransferase [Yersinia nurmii]|uniref:Acetyltransferase n=1 Tax=Yersinia nurmii TaxID=685706 RepID=A0ABM9S833_9GAMM|nr:putative acetyltransferase [Yersinia nurmii]